MDLRKIRHIAILGQVRHFGLAAERAGLTQSALTRSIQAAEAELGVRLFDRGRDGVHPTRAGQALLADAELLLQQLEILERNMALLSDRGSGEVRCGFGPLAAALVLEDMLSQAARDHAALRIVTKQGHAGDLIAQLRDASIEFAILAHPLVADEPGLSFRRIGQTRLGALVRREHPLAGRTVRQEELDGYPIIGGTGASATYAPTISCDNFQIAASVTLASDAIWITAEALADDRYALVYGLPVARQLDLVIVSLARRTLSAQALMLIELIVAALRRRHA